MTRSGKVRQYVIRCILAVVMLAAMGVAVRVYRCISTSAHAEKTLHAINLTTVVVDRFVQQERRWPNSWAELHKVKSAQVPSMYAWPGDAAKLPDFVVIDFDADLHVIANQCVDEFEAIHPAGAYYPYKDRGYVKALIETAKRHAAD